MTFIVDVGTTVFDGKEYRPTTNGDVMRSLTNEQIAEFAATDSAIDVGELPDDLTPESVRALWLGWINKEAILLGDEHGKRKWVVE